MKTIEKNVDFFVLNDHSIIMLYPESQAAKDWVTDNLCLDKWQSKDNIAIEPRMFCDIYDALMNEGFVLKAA